MDLIIFIKVSLLCLIEAMNHFADSNFVMSINQLMVISVSKLDILNIFEKILEPFQMFPREFSKLSVRRVVSTRQKVFQLNTLAKN